MSNGKDKPGQYRLISLTAQRLDVITKQFDQAEADGYKLVEMSDTVAAFYHEGEKSASSTSTT
jgi:hypothetical protein